jgi:uncharacterized membrane protein
VATPHPSHRARAWLAGALTLLYPVVIYLGLQYSTPRVMALALVTLAALRAGVAGQPGWRVLAMVACGLAVIVAVSGSAMPLKLYPAVVNATMLGLFAWSLWRPPTVVERIARLQDPELPPGGVAYTRRVTIAWCVFFVLNGALAVLTAAYGSDRVWAVYNGGIAYGLMGCMFAGEWLLRRRVLARERGVAPASALPAGEGR